MWERYDDLIHDKSLRVVDSFTRAFGYWAVLYTNGIPYRTEAQLGGETIADVGGGETTTTEVVLAYADAVREIEEYLSQFPKDMYH